MSIKGYLTCPICKKERFVSYNEYKVKNNSLICLSCKMLDNTHGSRLKHRKLRAGSNKEYIKVWISKDDFFFPMAQVKNKSYGYILEHRLVMAKHLGRCLQPWEIVHHKGIRFIGIENKSDNLIDNLKLTTKGSHSIEHNKGYRDGYKKGYEDGKFKAIKEVAL